MRWLAVVLSGLTWACGGAATTPATHDHADVVANGDSGGDAPSEPARPLSDEEAARAQAQAMSTHVRAQNAQDQCDSGDDRMCARARQLFQVAGTTWGSLVEGRVGDPGVAEWASMQAEALSRVGSYDRAADAAERSIAAEGPPDLRARAARSLVAARQAALRDAGVAVRDAPPEPSGDPPAARPIDMPAPVRALYDARARYVEVVADEEDADQAKRRYALDNAVLLHRYGRWDEARTALTALFDAGCAGETAWDGGATAWRALRTIALALGRYDTLLALGREVTERGCTFGTDEAPACGGELEDPRCIARTDAVSGALRGGTVLAQRAEHARGAERARWAGRAGQTFLEALELEGEGELGPLGRVTALTSAGDAFRMAGDAARAAEVDQRILHEVAPARFEEVDRPAAVHALGSAVARSLLAAGAAHDNEQIVSLARRLTTDELDIPALADARLGARRMLADALVALGRHRDAASAFTELAEATTDPAQRRDATLSAALELIAANDCRRAMPALRAFADEHRAETGARDGVVRALHHVAECQRHNARAYIPALEAIVAAADQTTGDMGADAANAAAEAAYVLIDREFADLSRIHVSVPRGDTIEALSDALRAELEEPLADVRDLAESYARVERFNAARWIATARLRSGQVFDALVAAVLAAHWEIPDDLAAQHRTLTRESYDQLRGITASRAAEILEAQASPIRCRAASQYFRATRVAGLRGADTDEVRAAREHLRTIGDAVVTRCRAANPGLFR